MPIYEYECTSCGKQFELFRSSSALDSTICKFCHGPVRKLISRSSFHLKGSGWYATDYTGKKSDDLSSSKKEDTTSKADEKKTGTSTTSEKSAD